MGKLTIRDGKFMRNGVVVKPEFGNVEQINLIKRAEREEADGYVSMHLECTCDTDWLISFSLSRGLEVE